MTMQEYILAKSYLPKNGTYTMRDHLQAMEMTVIGENQKLVVINKKENITVTDKKENVRVIPGRQDKNVKVSGKSQK